MSCVRRVDHVAVAVRDTEIALGFFADRLGLAVVHSEELESPHVRLTYLDAGNALIQLVEPLDGDTEIARNIEEDGEGLHHICFGVDDVERAITNLAGDGAPPPTLASGRGRLSAFLPGAMPLGVRIECTEFRSGEDGTEI
jgi:methylmalonyl-CoA/ethylmalonyl-CoA epimerase